MTLTPSPQEREAKLVELAESLYQHIKHGDAEHQAWLRRESFAWCRDHLVQSASPQEPDSMGASPSGTALSAPALRASAPIAGAGCAHEWKVTSQRALGMWCKCSKCGATKEETWD